MHYNNYITGFDDECTPTTVHAYCDAQDKLLAYLKNSRWKWLDCEGYGYTDRPLLVTEDMNYVYRLIQSRR